MYRTRKGENWWKFDLGPTSAGAHRETLSEMYSIGRFGKAFMNHTICITAGSNENRGQSLSLFDRSNEAHVSMCEKNWTLENVGHHPPLYLWSHLSLCSLKYCTTTLWKEISLAMVRSRAPQHACDLMMKVTSFIRLMMMMMTMLTSLTNCRRHGRVLLPTQP